MIERNVTLRGVHRSITSFASSVRNFLETHNTDARPFVWIKSADTILEDLRRYCDGVGATREQRILRQLSRTSQSPY
jgi:hypothetical protein